MFAYLQGRTLRYKGKTFVIAKTATKKHIPALVSLNRVTSYLRITNANAVPLSRAAEQALASKKATRLSGYFTWETCHGEQLHEVVDYFFQK